MKYNEAIKRAREYKALDQKDIADILNTTQQQVSLYETGQREMKASQIVALSRALNLTSDFLLGITDSPTPPKRPVNNPTE